jgi:hypothetical protein
MAEIYRILETGQRAAPSLRVWITPGVAMYAGAGQLVYLQVNERNHGGWELELRHIAQRENVYTPVQTRVWQHEPGHPLNDLPILGLQFFPRAIEEDQHGRPRRVLVEMALADELAAHLRPDSPSHEADRR